MKYGITAATGKFDQLALQKLMTLVPKEDIVALVRNVDKSKRILPAGITILAGDYTQPKQLAKSFQGIDKLLFISSIPGESISRAQ